MAKQTDIDAVLTNEQRQQQEFEAALAKAQGQGARKNKAFDAATDLEEIAPQPVKVSCNDFRIVDLLDNDGRPVLDDNDKPRKRREYFTRTAIIQTFVPTEMLFKTLALESELRGLAADKEKQQTNWIRFFAERVLEVWQMSEPDMTLERLQATVEFPKIRRLFNDFFGNLLGITVNF